MKSYRFNMTAIVLGLLLSFSAFAQAVGSKTALVIIDMQPYFVERGGNDKDPKNVEKVNQILANQAKLIEDAKASGTPIVLIEYNSYGQTNEKLRNAVGNYKDVRTFQKDSDGMFDDPTTKEQLQKFFSSRGIGNLIITGANGGACVEESIRGSLDNNYSVTAVAPGIADFNYSEFIFPYENRYTFFKAPACPSCTFKEVDDFSEAEALLGAGQQKQGSVQDGERSSGKETPTVRPGKKSAPNQATIQ